ncbi:MAG: hypothetical protein JJU46_07470 [Balneolaceae bacterium]|nr:hypothetical protein [Balneolaceae bacterium]MCH8547662.1 hypothetical protein [Balneolaceae bacterium]
MKSLNLLVSTIILAFAFQFQVNAQSVNLSETLKEHFNETVQAVKATDNAEEQRILLNDSFERMIEAVDRIEKAAEWDQDEKDQLYSLKGSIQDRMNELNGEDGYDEVVDEDLLDFSDYSQQMMEQANRNITLSLTTALLIVIILLLL